MNLGQTMITMGMFVLLVMSVISANRMLVQNAETGLQTEAMTESATIANDLFSEAQGNQFDHLVDTVQWPNGSQLQAQFSLRHSSGWGPLSVFPLPDTSRYGHPPLSATSSAYRSVDAYDGYRRFVDADTLNGIRIGGYILTVRVFYVDPANPDDSVSYRTFFKKIEVDVQHHPYLDFLPTGKLTYSSLMSY